MDPDNAVVKLCTQGMQAEAGGDDAGAKLLFEQAWHAAADDYERCIAAHYVARHQDGAEATLHWNEECLRYADLVGDERVAGFYPSLHLNIGYCREQMRDRAGARAWYLRAEALLAGLPDGAYGDMIRDGVRRGLERVGAEQATADAAERSDAEG